MFDEPSQEQLAKVPPIASILTLPYDATLLHLHFFIPESDIARAQPHFKGLRVFVRGTLMFISAQEYHWYVAGYDPDEALCYGFITEGNPHKGRWGSFDFDGLLSLRGDKFEVRNDTSWKLKTFAEFRQILKTK